jgi:hypothetical protein
MLITYYGLAGLVAAVAAYAIASAKHRDASHWATVSFLFPPAVLITLLLTRSTAEHRLGQTLDKKLKRYIDDVHDD